MATNGDDVLDPWANPFADDNAGRSTVAAATAAVTTAATSQAFDDGGFGTQAGGSSTGGFDGGGFGDGDDDEDARFAAVLASTSISAATAPNTSSYETRQTFDQHSDGYGNAGGASSSSMTTAYPYSSAMSGPSGYDQPAATTAFGGDLAAFDNGFGGGSAQQAPFGYSPPLSSILANRNASSDGPLPPTPSASSAIVGITGVDDLLGDENAGGLLSGAGGLKAAFKKREKPAAMEVKVDVNVKATAGASGSQALSPAKKAAMRAGSSGGGSGGGSVGAGSATATQSVKSRRKRGIVAATTKAVEVTGKAPEAVKAAASPAKEPEGGSATGAMTAGKDGAIVSPETTTAVQEGEADSQEGAQTEKVDSKGPEANGSQATSKQEASAPEETGKTTVNVERDQEQSGGLVEVAGSHEEAQTSSATKADDGESLSPSKEAVAEAAGQHSAEAYTGEANPEDAAASQVATTIPPTGEPGKMDLKTLPPLPASEAGTPRVATPIAAVPSPPPSVAAPIEPPTVVATGWTTDVHNQSIEHPQEAFEQRQIPAQPQATFYHPVEVAQPQAAFYQPVKLQAPSPPAFAADSRPPTPPQPRPPPTFIISLSDPTKVGDPIRGHVVYTVTTHTTSSHFSRSHFTVLRRFSDFLWLFDALTANNPGVIVPPVPDKHLFGRFEETFIETRRAALERCLSKMANHPVLGLDPDLRMFLESDTLQRRNNEPSSANRLATTLTSMAGPKFVESDEWFDAKRAYVDGLEVSLKSLVKSIETTSKQRVELVAATGELLDAVTELGECDLATDLTAALQRLAELTRREKELLEENARGEIGHVLSLCDEYIRLVSSIRVCDEQLARGSKLMPSAVGIHVTCPLLHQLAKPRSRCSQGQVVSRKDAQGREIDSGSTAGGDGSVGRGRPAGSRCARRL